MGLSFTRSRRVSWLALLLASVGPCAVLANPQGGTVVAGSASIGSSGSTLTVTQSSDKAIIDWRGFDIAAGETTTFKQPSGSSLTLNRVNSASASLINGTLTANGNVVIVNQNGVLFGKNSVVNVNSLLATTADIDNAKFMAGEMTFDKPGNPYAVIENQGRITAKEAGLVGLVAPNVLNSGVITAKLGRIHLASGDTATVDFYGDGLLEIKASPALQEQIVENTGLLSAEGGTIQMTAAAAAETVQSLIHVGGELDARSVGTKNGNIIIYAEGSNAVQNNVAADKGQKSGSSTVLVDGYLDASGRQAGEHGGTVTVTGDNVALLNGTIIDASGSDGASNTTAGKAVSAPRTGSAGGDIKIGGDYLGQGATPTAKNLYVAPSALILNDALSTGDAGRNIFWSDGATQFYGVVYARALGGLTPDPLTWSAAVGGNSGDGGFVETSGHGQLTAQGYVDLTASDGKRGTYFLDPTNVSIYGNVDPAFNSSGSITDGTQVNLSAGLQLWLDAADTSAVTLNYNSLGTTASGTSGSNTITVGSTTGLVVGERIQLDGSTHSYAASVNDNASSSGIYTITAINGTTVTLDANLATTYSGAALYGGYVSQVADKSGQGNNVTQATEANMPLWISNGQNGLGELVFNGTSTSLSNATLLNGYTGSLSAFAIAISQDTGSTSDLIGNRGDGGYGILDANGGAPRFTTYGNADYTGNGGYWNPTNSILASLVFDSASNVVTFWKNGKVDALVGPWSGASASNNPFGVGNNGQNEYFLGSAGEIFLYTAALNSSAFSLLNQYESAKWNVALTPSGTGATEVAKATAADGYSVFAASYLNRLSQSADISLQASNNINVDLQGSTLSLAAGRNLTLTAGNQILTNSTGTITTSQNTGVGGDITFNATNGIFFNNAFALNSGGGAISLNGPTTLNAALTANAESGTLTFGTVDGAHDLTASAKTFVLGGALGGTTPLAAVSLTSDDTLTLPSISASSILAQTTGASADIVIPVSETLSASGAGTAIALESKHDFINNAGAGALTASSGRWLVYSTTPGADTFGSLNSGNTAIWNKANGAAVLQSGNRYVFSYQPTVAFTSGNLAKTYGVDDAAAVAADYTVSGLQTGMANAFLGDSNATAFSGAPSVTSSGSASTASVSSGPYSLDVAQGSLAGVDGYALSYASTGTLTVNKATLTVTADNKGMAYGAGSLPTLTDTITGYANGEDAGSAGVTGAPTLSTAATAYNGTSGSGSDVGGYTITAAANNLAAANYNFVYANGTLTVSPVALTITGNNQTMTYGGTMPTLTVGYSGFVNGESSSNLTTAPTVTSATAATANAGTYTGTITATGAVDNNYTISYAAGNLTIDKAALLVTANNQTMTYGGTMPTLTASYSGFVNGDSSGSLTTAPTVTSATPANANAGTYTGTITATGAVDNNYTISYAAGNLTIDKAALLITANNQAITYGTLVPSDTLAYTGFVNGDSASDLATAPVVVTTISGIADVGTYTGNYTVSGASGGNYTITYANGNLTVLRRSLTVTTDDKTMVADAPTPIFTGSNNLIVQDVPLINWTYAPVGYSGGAGSYLITATASDPQNRLANYNVTMVEGTLTSSASAPSVLIPSTVVMNSQMPSSAGTPSTIPPVFSDDSPLPQSFPEWRGNNFGAVTNLPFNVEISPALQQLLELENYTAD